MSLAIYAAVAVGGALGALLRDVSLLNGFFEIIGPLPLTSMWLAGIMGLSPLVAV